MATQMTRRKRTVHLAAKVPSRGLGRSLCGQPLARTNLSTWENPNLKSRGHLWSVLPDNATCKACWRQAKKGKPWNDGTTRLVIEET